MNRDTRKANLKKLQLPVTGKDVGDAIRKTQSCKASSKEATAIERYFSTQSPAKQEIEINKNQCEIINENESEKPKQSVYAPMFPSPKIADEIEKPKRTKRTKLTSFLYKDSTDIPAKDADNEVFEAMPNKCKSVPKVKTKTPKARKTRNNKTKAKRQQDIKSAFLRNEQLFSEITAQHCLADNFSPEEMQLALAISKSEAEVNGVQAAEDNEEEIVVDIETAANNFDESIRTKLKKYGFRTAPKEDFDNLAAAFRTGFNRRQKGKWANKFTALTLRNPEFQLKKINEKIDDFFSKQCFTKQLSDAESHMAIYQPNSIILQRVKSTQQAEVFSRAENLNIAELKSFYVEELFEISHIRSGHLLKNWAGIQGRDLSPSKWSTQKKHNDARFHKAYRELEKFLCEETISKGTENKNSTSENLETDTSMELKSYCANVISVMSNPVELNSSDDNHCELSEMIELIEREASQMGVKNIILEARSGKNTPSGEPPEKKLKSDVPDEADAIKQKDLIPLPLKEYANCNRLTSPDIFAISDDEVDDGHPIFSEVELKNNSVTKYNGIEICEDYSSNEAPDSHSCILVDLTQEDSNSMQDKGHPETSTIIKPTEALLMPQEILQRADNFSPTKSLDFNIISLNSPISSSSNKNLSFEATNDTIFQALKRKYLGSSSRRMRKSLSATQANGSRSSFSKSKRHLSFTQQKHEVNRVLDSTNVSNTSDEIDKTPEKISSEYHDRVEKDLNLNAMENRTSLDLTQNEESEDDCIMLSDDEINYSIWKADKSINQASKNSSVENAKDFMSSFSDMKGTNTQNKTDKDSASSPDFKCSKVPESEDDCIMLSDDEINYSIWKADKSIIQASKNSSVENAEDFISSFSDMKGTNTQNKTDKDSASVSDFKYSEVAAQNFSYLDLVDVEKSFKTAETSDVSCTQACLNLEADGDNEPIHSQYLVTQTDLDLCSPTPETTKPNELNSERAEYGILECYSEPFTETPFKTPIKKHKSIDISYLSSPSEKVAPMKRYSSLTNSQKFNELLKNVGNTQTTQSSCHFEEYDEFDRIVYGTPKLKSPIKPRGFEQLLTGEISFHEAPKQQCYTTPKKLYISPIKCPVPKKAPSPNKPQELHIDGKLYTVRVTTSPKPDFSKQTDAELLKQLYNFGIKPLKRGQALKILEFIYNQTHPILVNENESSEENHSIPTTNQKAFNNDLEYIPESMPVFKVNANENLKAMGANKFNLSDCSGEMLLRHSYHLSADLINEEYIFQTNVSKKILQPLIPLHVAWFNLVCSNVQLHEAILMYEPIDLQEIYLFFKSLGYRYDPKDLKTFFDRRCIIFRYDLTRPGTNRHVRKNKKTRIKR